MHLGSEFVGVDAQELQTSRPALDEDEAEQAGGYVEGGDNAGSQAQLVDDDAEQRTQYCSSE